MSPSERREAASTSGASAGLGTHRSRLSGQTHRKVRRVRTTVSRRGESVRIEALSTSTATPQAGERSAEALSPRGAETSDRFSRPRESYSLLPSHTAAVFAAGSWVCTDFLGDICDSCLTSSWAELRATVVLIAVSVGEVVVEAGPIVTKRSERPSVSRRLRARVRRLDSTRTDRMASVVSVRCSSAQYNDYLTYDSGPSRTRKLYIAILNLRQSDSHQMVDPRRRSV